MSSQNTQGLRSESAIVVDSSRSPSPHLESSAAGGLSTTDIKALAEKDFLRPIQHLPPPVPELPALFFLGKENSPPIVFSQGPPWIAPRCNARWIAEGILDKGEYLEEITESRHHLVVINGQGRTEQCLGRKARQIPTPKLNSPNPLRQDSSDIERKPNIPTQVERQGAAGNGGGRAAKPKSSRYAKAPHNPNQTRESSANDSLFARPGFKATRGWSAAQSRALWESQVSPSQ